MNKYSSYILYLLISIFVAIMYINHFGPMNSLQRSLDDSLCKLTATEGKRPNIALIMVDGSAMNEFGNWPWDNDLIADLVAATASGNPKGIVLDFELAEDAAQDSAGHTDILAGQLSWIENAILSYDIALATYRSSRTTNPQYLFNNSISTNNPLGVLDEESSLLVRKVFLPAEKLLTHKPYLGFDYLSPDKDRTLRHQALVMNYEGYYYPSLTLMAASVYLGVPPDQIKIIENDVIQVGNQRTISISDHSEYFICFSKGKSFTRYSAAEVLGEGFDFSRFKDKLVLIGVDDPLFTETFDTPVEDAMHSTWVKATVIENIVNENIITPKNDLPLFDLLILFVLGGVFAFALPRVSLMHRLIILAGSLIVLANVNYFLVSSLRVIPQTVYLALELMLFMAASPILDSRLITGETKSKPARSRAKLPKIKIEKKFEEDEIPVREIRSSSRDPENIKTRQIDYETQAPDTTEVLDHQTIDPDAQFSGAEKETATPPGVETPTALGSESETIRPPADKETFIPSDDLHVDDQPTGSPTVESSGDDTPAAIPTASDGIKNLGRYQVMGILGKGAMGTVYKGIDPAINRPVALKTIRLDFVNDPAEMAELKERLFREAQAAGKLSHPNIVTIYDVGSEGHLQYIAMEYLKGQTLEDMIRKKVKFNYRIIAQIITQICNALDYAHDQGIVHRDIKPANIMILKDYRAKVMDYGIARIDSSSMTKTGIAMGTPNYISPEQLKGLTIDRRADIFSLGVVIYEMLLGRRPFKGENITSLIYAILNNEPEKPSNVNPQIPLLFDHVISTALKKNPAERYQKASEITAALHDFTESFASR